ncbi:MAG: hypothetical protein DWQ36_20195 [Acidobacteria bacterium]|nr:MAG: hypothetical protein DWQ36_20195 [Acidobacteriota bacterium]
MRSAVAVARGAEQAVGGPEGSGDRGQGIGVRGWGSGVWGQGLGVRGQGFGARPRTRGAKGAEQVAGVWRRRMYGRASRKTGSPSVGYPTTSLAEVPGTASAGGGREGWYP